MTFSVFVNFDGDCREAVEFYAKIFGISDPQLMTYGDAPGGDTSEKDKERIMYAELLIGDCKVMFMDFSSDMQCVKGNNVQLTLSETDKQEVTRLFNELKQGGTVGMELQETFWSGLYGMVIDKFGVQWHIMHDNGQYSK